MTLPMKDSVEGASGLLTPNQAATLINLVLQKAEVAGTLLRDPRHFISMRVDTVDWPVQSATITPSGIAEAATKPSGAPTFTYVQLKGYEMAFITAISDKLLRDSYIDMDALIRSDIIDGFADRLDRWIIGSDATPHATWGTNAGFDYSVAATGQTFAAGGYADDGLLLSAMLTQLESNANFKRSACRWYVKPAVAGALRDARTSNGAPLFVADLLNQDGTFGRIFGIPVTEVAAAKFPANVDAYLVDLDKCLFGTRFDTVQIDVSNQAAYTVSESLVSAFETDTTLYRGHNTYAFQIADNTAVCAATGIV